ncbi:DASH family cryptochrome [Salisediminibacterium halotolerans]|uniref:Cryptochrome DASH n=1 Tax=Salisediminibacterium halotolerans TaxID=517425 RepID=A0A1H9TB77_9BACI|nr:DASH family cryptochrome [Salisediminibacterium haloalkalitolerans]SER94297.1 deoxyribodipyrimidine photo-lyase [Salisediminibacterium haloalkalitolerans]
MNLVWFRHDLRIHDHLPLKNALQSERETEAVYVLDSRNHESVSPGLRRMGAKRFDFLAESLRDLEQSLEKLAVPLAVLAGTVTAVLEDVIRENEVTNVYVHAHPGVEERKDLEELMQRFPEVRFHVSAGHTLLRPDQLPFDRSVFPMSFSRFRRELEKILPIPTKAAVFSPQEAALFQETVMPPAQGTHLNDNRSRIRPLTDGLAGYPNQKRFVEGGETAGIRQLKAFVHDPERLFAYKETRDGLLRFHDSSKLSFWLANGSLSPKRVYQDILQMEAEHGRNESSYWLFFELLWREYFQWLMWMTGSRLFQRRGFLPEDLPWHEDEHVFAKWAKGETGYPLVDAAMKELNATGYMSNRARQNAASFLTKNLGIDWRWGARYFEEQLLDYDPASNYGNWAYQAGVGTDMRELRAFHVIRQGERYDPGGDYAKYWLELPEHIPGKDVYDPDKLKLYTGVSEPIVNFADSLEKRKKELGYS